MIRFCVVSLQSGVWARTGSWKMAVHFWNVKMRTLQTKSNFSLSFDFNHSSRWSILAKSLHGATENQIGLRKEMSRSFSENRDSMKLIYIDLSQTLQYGWIIYQVIKEKPGVQLWVFRYFVKNLLRGLRRNLEGCHEPFDTWTFLWLSNENDVMVSLQEKKRNQIAHSKLRKKKNGITNPKPLQIKYLNRKYEFKITGFESEFKFWATNLWGIDCAVLTKTSFSIKACSQTKNVGLRT